MWPKDSAALPAGGLTDVIREAIARSGALHEAAKAAEALKEQQAREEQEMKGQVHATFSVISLARVRARARSLSLSPVCFFLSFFLFFVRVAGARGGRRRALAADADAARAGARDAQDLARQQVRRRQPEGQGQQGP